MSGSFQVCGEFDTLWPFPPPLVGTGSSFQPLLLLTNLFTTMMSGEWPGLGEEEGEGVLAMSSSSRLVLEAFIKLLGESGRSTTTCSYERRREDNWSKYRQK